MDRLRARMGDFWWYSLMLFCACRAADLLNAFVGLWLVPRYVPQEELGALTPLASFASFLAVPVAAFANAFRNEISRLAGEREFGKLKSLLRGVFLATAAFLLVAVAAAHLLLPAFLARIRIVEGALGLAILAASFVSAVAPIYTNALQALKKFRTQSVVNVVGAPVRLAVMLVAMPFRALTGYFAGQAAVPAFNIAASVFGLRRELSAKPEPYWRREALRKFSRLFALFLAGGAAGGMYGLVESTVLRQRLPDMDSGAFYAVTRFSEIAAYLLYAVSFALFPLAADLSRRHCERMRLVWKALAANMAFCAIVAAAFSAFGRLLMSIPAGGRYADYWWAVPWHIAITALCAVQALYTTAEIAAGRFGFLKWIVPMDLAYPALLLLVTGHGYFAGVVPASWTAFLDAHNVRTLSTMLWWMTAANAAKCAGCLFAMARASRSRG